MFEQIDQKTLRFVPYVEIFVNREIFHSIHQHIYESIVYMHYSNSQERGWGKSCAHSGSIQFQL